MGRSRKWFLNEVKFAPVKNGYTARKERQRHNSARVKKSVKVSFSTGRVSVIEIKKPQSDPRESPTKPSLGKDGAKIPYLRAWSLL